MSNLSRVAVPLCGVLIGSALLGAIALHEQAAALIAAPAVDPIEVSAVSATPAVDEIDAPIEVENVERVAPPIDRADPRQYGFVIEVAGTSYVQLTANADETAVKRGRARLVNEDGVYSAVAPIAVAQLPARLHDWIGKRVMVEGTCSAKVVGFARIARLAGDTAYAGIHGPDSDDDSPPATWTAGEVMDHGAPMLAAKLDGCHGTWARDAALPAAIPAIALPADPALVAAARTDLARTDAATATAAEWKQNWGDTDFGKHYAEARFDVRLVLHPATGERWLIAHASEDEGCGAPHLNLVGVYRVDAAGKLARVAAYDSEIQSIDALIDVDGDGRFELRAMSGFIADPALLDRDGSPLSGTSVPYFGCPC